MLAYRDSGGLERGPKGRLESLKTPLGPKGAGLPQAGFKILLAHSEALPDVSAALPANSKALPASFENIPNLNF